MSVLVKRILALALIAVFGMSLAACETAAAFARDVEKLVSRFRKHQ